MAAEERNGPTEEEMEEDAPQEGVHGGSVNAAEEEELADVQARPAPSEGRVEAQIPPPPIGVPPLHRRPTRTTGILETVAHIAWLARVMGAEREAVQAPLEEDAMATMPDVETALPPSTEEEGFIPVPQADREDPEPGELMAAEAPPSRVQMREVAMLLRQQVEEEQR